MKSWTWNHHRRRTWLSQSSLAVCSSGVPCMVILGCPWWVEGLLIIEGPVGTCLLSPRPFRPDVADSFRRDAKLDWEQCCRVLCFSLALIEDVNSQGWGQPDSPEPTTASWSSASSSASSGRAPGALAVPFMTRCGEGIRDSWHGSWNVTVRGWMGVDRLVMLLNACSLKSWRKGSTKGIGRPINSSGSKCERSGGSRPVPPAAPPAMGVVCCRCSMMLTRAGVGFYTLSASCDFVKQPRLIVWINTTSGVLNRTYESQQMNISSMISNL